MENGRILKAGCSVVSHIRRWIGKFTETLTYPSISIQPLRIMKKTIISLLSVVLIALASTTAIADHHKDPSAPHSVIHVVTVSWKEDATPKQIQAALDSVKTLAKEYDGISRVWIRSIKAQGDRTHAFVMEFTSEKALKNYSGSDAQKKWYLSYLPYRDASTTFDITN